MELKNRKLLLMGGGAYAKTLSAYAKEKEFGLIAVGNIKDAPHKLIADRSYMVDTMDIDAVVEIVQKEQCNGIFVGALEANILPAISVAERTGINFYTDRALWNKLSNKRRFKELLSEHHIGVTEAYHLTKDFCDADTKKITYPVIVKPVDGCGARGISVCNSLPELKKGYARAHEASLTGEALVEKYITGMDDMFIHYTIIDGEISLSCTFDRNLNFAQDGYTGMAIAYTYPSIYTERYIKKVDKLMKEAFKDAGIVNGAINIQCFTDGEDFFFYEAGYRLGGEQMYFFTEQLTGINICKLVINQALTGKMTDDPKILLTDNPYFSKPCLNLYIPLKAGRITELDGIETLLKHNAILNITQFLHKGDSVVKDGSLSQVCLRMHLMADNVEELATTVDFVNKTLRICDENGVDMMLEKFDLRRTKYYNQFHK